MADVSTIWAIVIGQFYCDVIAVERLKSVIDSAMFVGVLFVCSVVTSQVAVAIGLVLFVQNK